MAAVQIQPTVPSQFFPPENFMLQKHKMAPRDRNLFFLLQRSLCTFKWGYVEVAALFEKYETLHNGTVIRPHHCSRDPVSFTHTEPTLSGSYNNSCMIRPVLLICPWALSRQVVWGLCFHHLCSTAGCFLLTCPNSSLQCQGGRGMTRTWQWDENARWHRGEEGLHS